MTEELRFRFGERELTAPGSTIASALLGNGIVSWRTTRRDGAPRGLFCGIGHCHDCLVDVNDRQSVRACQHLLRAGDHVRPGSVAAPVPAAHVQAAAEHVADVAVVGAGPGGMAAALAAADAGCRVVLIDSAQRVGGQIHRQPATAIDAGGALPDRFRRVVAHPRITVLTGTTVWHAGQEGEMFVLRCIGTDGSETGAVVAAQAVVLATGATELVLPFPGWTLPGVITAGAAQALLKAQPRTPAADLLPGPRVLLAGTGPLLLRAAADLVNRGATVVAVCEASRPASMLSGLPKALRHPGKLAEGAAYAVTLARARPRVKMLGGWTVTGCYREGRVQQVRIASVGSPARSRMFAVDAVAVSHGLVPALDLSRALGCADDQLADFPAAVVAVDQAQATSTSGVFACGELTGVGGAAKAEPEGEVAGLAAARRLGRLDEAAFRRKARGAIIRVRRAKHFALLLSRLYPLAGHGWPDWLDPGTVICRCEEATLADLRRAVAAGAADLRTIKGMTRCGMGYCQGRICGPVAQYAAARITGRSLAELGDLHTRHLAAPIPLGVLADQAADLGTG